MGTKNKGGRFTGNSMLKEVLATCRVCKFKFVSPSCGKYGSGFFGTCSPWCARLMKYL